jgi:hypothetical protein
MATLWNQGSGGFGPLHVNSDNFLIPVIAPHGDGGRNVAHPNLIDRRLYYCDVL